MPPPPAATTTPFVGRSPEIDRIRSALDQGAAGVGGLVLVTGGAGIGKSRLVAEAIAGGPPITVLTATARALDAGRPFGALVEALTLDPPDLDRSGSLQPDSMWLGIDDLVERIRARAEAAPLALVLDGLQWADPATWHVVAALARRSPTIPVATIAIARSLPEVLVELESPVHVALDPLTVDESFELAGAVVGGEPGPVLRRAIAGAAGNPFVLTELLDALAADGQLRHDAGTVERVGTDLPLGLTGAITRRMVALDPDTQDVLRRASAIDGAFGLAELGLVAAADPLTTSMSMFHP